MNIELIYPQPPAPDVVIRLTLAEAQELLRAGKDPYGNAAITNFRSQLAHWVRQAEADQQPTAGTAWMRGGRSV